MKSADHLPSASRHVIAALLLTVAEAHAQAQAAGPGAAPDAGAILQQLQPTLPTAPQGAQPSLQLTPAPPAGLPPSRPFAVREIRIAGNTVFGADTLHALVADQQGRQLTLPQLEGIAGRITAYYQNHGYPLARAVIPAQAIQGGAVTIQVVEARYGRIRLDNGTEVAEPLPAATADALRPGEQIEERRLDRTLLLLSDIPGVGVGAVLKPGTEVGTSDLDLGLTRVQSTASSAMLDNYGNRYVGRARASGNFNLVNPLHHGDVLSIAAISSGEGLQFGRLGYDTLVNGLGTRVGGAYSFVHYRLGGGLDALDAHGTAGVASLWARQPLLRSRQTNVYGQIQYDGKRLRDHIDANGTRTDRHLDNWVLSLNGDARDGALAGGVSIWGLGWTAGRLGFDDAAAQAANAASARTSGGFSKWNANFSRLQGLSRQDTLNLTVAGQWSDGNLDSAEKLTVGGPYTVRAYDIGAVSSDTGVVATVEWRHDLGPLGAGKWQTLAFVDSARVKINRRPWSPGENSATLSGAGVGLAWDGPGLWRAAVSVAGRIGNRPAVAASSSTGRIWLTASKSFF